MFGNLGTIWAEIGLDTRKLEQGLVQSKTKLITAERDIKSMGAALTRHSNQFMIAGAAMSGAAVLAAGASVKMAAEFETSMRNVNSIMQVSEEELAGISDEIINISRELPQSAKVLADGLYDIASSGFAGAEGIKVLEAAARAASAGMTDTATSAKGITAVLNAYGWEAKEADRVSDTLFKTVDKGVVTFEELTNNIGGVVGTGNLANIELEEIAGALGYITTQGYNAAEATTALNRLILDIIQPSEALAEVLYNAGYESGELALKELGLAGVMNLVNEASGGSITNLQEMFIEMRALRGAGALLGNGIESLTDYMADFKDTTGATNTALEEQSKSLSYQLDILKNNAKAIGITLGNELIPNITKTVSGLSEWISENEELATGLIKLTGAGVGGTGLLLLTASAIGKIRAAVVALNGTALGIAGAGVIGGIGAMIAILGLYTTAIYNAGNANEEAAKKVKEKEKADNDAVIAEKNRQIILKGKTQTLRAATDAEKENLDVVELSSQDYWEYADRQQEAKEAILETKEATEEATVETTKNLIANQQNEMVIENLVNAYGLTEEAAREYAEAEGLLVNTTKETTKAIDEQKESIDELIESIFELYNLNQSTTEATWAFEDALKNYNEVLKDSNLTEREKQEALFAVQDAYEETLLAISKEIEAVGTNIKREEELQEKYVKSGLKAVETGAISETAFIEMAKQFDISSGEIIKFADDMGIVLDEVTKERIIKLGLDTSGFDSSLSAAINRINMWEEKHMAGGGIVGYSGGGIISAASGAIVPQTGRAVPIVAHEDETILNTSHQRNLAEWIMDKANTRPDNTGGQPIYITNVFEVDGQQIYTKTDEYFLKNQKIKLIGAGIR